MSFEIELTREERALLSGIELDQSKMDHGAYLRQGPLILQLLQSLRQRNAIPSVRLLYWTDPDYNTGRLRTSNLGLFERNGCKGEQVYKHPNFLSYLRYFIFGANLPNPAASEFKEIVGDPNWVTSGDITEITKGTRSIVRKYGLHGEEEEFYRLALDIGLSQTFSKAVRDAAKQVR